nr:MAG TPA: hypothetical protein [Bacteriophage sp.]
MLISIISFSSFVISYTARSIKLTYLKRPSGSVLIP